MVAKQKPKRIPTAWLKRYVTERGLQPHNRELKRIEIERDVYPTAAFRIYFEEMAPPNVRAALRNAWRQHCYRERKAKEEEALRNSLARAEAAAEADLSVLIDPRPFVAEARRLLREANKEVTKSYAVYVPQTIQEHLQKLEKLIDQLEDGKPLRNGKEV